MNERLSQISYHDLPASVKPLADDILKISSAALGGPYNALLRSPEMARRCFDFLDYLRFRTSVNKRLNEFAILIQARISNAQFEWWAHYRQAVEAGLKAEIGDAVREGRRPSGMAQDEEILYDFLTEALKNNGVCDTTYARAVKQYGEQGVIDLLAVAGYYGLLALVMNVARTPVPEGPALPLPGLPVRIA